MLHTPLHRRKAYIFLVILAWVPVDSVAVNFSQCFADITTCANNSSSQACASLNISDVGALSLLRTSKGTPVVTTDAATAISYTGCYQHCGEGQEPFTWTVFSQEYSQWLLPYLALLSQLPFGSWRRMDNLMSAILTLGSPTLAGYSLYMTLLNARWVNIQLFSGVDYPSAAVRQSVVQVLSSLQQVPLRIHPGKSGRFESLVVHPDNDNWWTTFAEELDYSQTWSIASATMIAWVVIAYLLTVADSLSNVADNLNSNGQGTGSVWLWLLPIVMGWLVLSLKFDFDRVNKAYKKANRQVFVANARDPIEPPTQVISHFGLTISPSPQWELYHRNITSPDESRTPPIFNYSRTLSWCRTVYMISLFYRTAWRKSSHRVGVDGQYIPGNGCNDLPRESRLGARDQIIRYCHPGHHEYPGMDVLWPRGVLFNMFVASLMSLQLQWGTTSAAILAAFFTPTIGLGCRSLAYLMYGILSTVVWILLLSSSILGYYAHNLTNATVMPILDSECDEQHPLRSVNIDNRSGPSGVGSGLPVSSPDYQGPGLEAEPKDIPLSDDAANFKVKYADPGRKHAQTIARVADWLRWIGKLLAIVNAIGIIANAIFQFSGVYDNCYCNSSVYTWGATHAFNVVNPIQRDIDLARKAWIGALALGLTCCTVFVGAMYLVRDSLPS